MSETESKVEDNVNAIIPAINKDIKIYDRKDCKLCQSEFREFAERAFDEEKSMRSIMVILHEKGVSISYPAVRNHLIFHYGAEQKAIRLNEHAKDLQRWMESEIDRESEIRSRIAVLKRQIYTISAETEGKSLDEQRKSADTIKRLMESITTCEEKLDAKLADMKPVEIVIKGLKELINSEISVAQSEETKTTLGSLLLKLSQNKALEDILFERKK